MGHATRRSRPTRSRPAFKGPSSGPRPARRWTSSGPKFGDLVEIGYSFLVGIGGDPANFRAEVKEGAGVLAPDRNLIVKPARRVIGAVVVAALLRANKAGKATVTLSVKGGNGRPQTFEVRVAEKGPER